MMRGTGVGGALIAIPSELLRLAGDVVQCTREKRRKETNGAREIDVGYAC